MGVWRNSMEAIDERLDQKSNMEVEPKIRVQEDQIERQSM